jgi:hypothetical protein
MKCKTHPRYKAVQKPRSGCLDCWNVYADKRQTIVDDLFKAAETGGAELRSAILLHGGPAVSMYDTALSYVVAAAVNWRHGPNMQNRKFTTELDHKLVSAVDAMLEASNDS